MVNLAVNLLVTGLCYLEVCPGIEHMAFFSSYWSVPGVSPEARDAAARAASAQELELGDWLSDLIHRVSAEELNATATGSRAAQTVEVKLTSIERAMLRPSAGGLAGSFSRA